MKSELLQKIILLLFHTSIQITILCILMRKGVRPHLSGSVHMLYSEIWYWFHIRIHVMFSHVSCTWDCLLTNVTKKRWCGECIIWIWLWDASNGSQKTRNWISFFVSLQSDYLMYIQKEFWLVKILDGSTFNFRTLSLLQKFQACKFSLILFCFLIKSDITCYQQKLHQGLWIENSSKSR